VKLGIDGAWGNYFAALRLEQPEMTSETVEALRAAYEAGWHSAWRRAYDAGLADARAQIRSAIGIKEW
jgi:hypothetical protein